MFGGTAFAGALGLCQSQLTGASDPRVVVLLTDGVNGDMAAATAAADAIKADGITLITIGVGSGVDTANLMALASSPDLFIPVTNFGSFPMVIEEIVTSLCPLPACVNFDCAKCGQVLECYVSSGFDELDAAVCEAVLDSSTFCPIRGGRATSCQQQCSGRQGVKCIPGSSFGSCPSMIGSNPQCMGGAGRDGTLPADLSNFASYQACFAEGGNFDVTCLIDKCEDGSSCACAQPFA
ncbi:von Willebrand factor A-like protein [Gracilaria domingensis]|nr:von Willebrand factor A-like protein [Gracilaria domingensis]